MKKKVLILFLLTCIMLFFITKKESKIDSFNEIKSISNMNELIKEQKRVDSEINLISNNKEINLENSLVIKNPYYISPLSYLIVFHTNTYEEVSIYINDKYINTFNKSKKHIIPVYGLINDFENNIKIILSNGEEKTILIKTDKVEVSSLSVLKENNDIGYLSFTSNNTLMSSIYDSLGNVVWSLDASNFVDTIFLENGNMLTTYFINDIEYLIEIDYLGKIYNCYKINNHLNHTFYEFKDIYALITYSEDEISRNDMVYLINKNNGKILYKVDLYKILSKYSDKFKEEKLYDEDWAHINSLYLKDDELLVSLRKSNSIISINYKKETINYIVNGSNYFDEHFDKFIIKPNFDMLSQHSLYLDEEGNFVIFNNNVNRIKHLVDSIEVYEDKKESYPAVFKVDLKTKTASLIWKYTYKDKLLFAPAFSSFKVLSNGNKIINYSCLIDEVNGKYLYENQYMKIIILDSLDNIIFEAEKKGDSVVNVYSVDIYSNYLNQNKKANTKIMEVE